MKPVFRYKMTGRLYSSAVCCAAQLCGGKLINHGRSAPESVISMNNHVSTPEMGDSTPPGLMIQLNTFLDRYILPYPVKYLTNRLTILATLGLLLPLIIFANVQVFVLATNSYLNVMSVVVSSTVLLYSTISEQRDRKAAARREEIANAHEAMVEARAKADHELILSIQEELRQHINERLENIQKILIEHLEINQAEDHAHDEALHQATMDNDRRHQQQLAELNKMVEAMQKPPRLN
ncbi:MAG: hypothetical protein J0L63_13520 [Anaerolineae bacterium]|nr:hypothetical protein [Anaerolineae bacterium]MBN8619925.1 hypothetical protein [Anaerolineae bacterium]